MIFPAPDIIHTNGINMAVYRAGPNPEDTDKPPVVLMHGFPEIAYSWRYQIQALAQAGYPVFAPDMRGYGLSDKPEGVQEYTMKKLCDDMAGLLSFYGMTKAAFIGHDWGALVLWSLPFYQPDILLGCAGLNVPFLPRNPKMDPIEKFEEVFGKDMYIVRFQEEGASEAILEADVARTMRFFMRRPRTSKASSGDKSFGGGSLDLLNMLQGDEKSWFGENWLSDEDMEIYTAAFSAGGFTAPIHYYRNMAKNWRDMDRFQPIGGTPEIKIPCLMITAEKDAACPPALADGMQNYCPVYERVDLKDCGHWSQQEQHENVNVSLIEWLVEHWG